MAYSYSFLEDFNPGTRPNWMAEESVEADSNENIDKSSYNWPHTRVNDNILQSDCDFLRFDRRAA